MINITTKNPFEFSMDNYKDDLQFLIWSWEKYFFVWSGGNSFAQVFIFLSFQSFKIISKAIEEEKKKTSSKAEICPKIGRKIKNKKEIKKKNTK
jgi:hypothetical protein